VSNYSDERKLTFEVAPPPAFTRLWEYGSTISLRFRESPATGPAAGRANFPLSHSSGRRIPVKAVADEARRDTLILTTMRLLDVKSHYIVTMGQIGDGGANP
jgi:hypothetical protein